MITRADIETKFAFDRSREEELEHMEEHYEETPPVELEIERLKEQDKLEYVLILLDEFLEVDNYE